MFTGIIEEKGILQAKEPGSLRIGAKKVLEGTKLGDSIAVNGVCLTVTKITAAGFEADVMPQTLRVSGLSEVKPGETVNLERAMAADGRFGGHMVTGHIDGVGKIRAVKPEQNAVWVEVVPPREILEGIVEKGSIAMDGVSLTVAKLTKDSFLVSLIPHTRGQTNMEYWTKDRSVNLETDIVGKYVRKWILRGKPELCEKAEFKEKPESQRGRETKINMQFLSEHGFV